MKASKSFCFVMFLLLVLAASVFGSLVWADIVALRTIACDDADNLHEACGGNVFQVQLPEVNDPIDMHYTQLIRFGPDVEVLIDPGLGGAIDSPSVSVDGESVWYARCAIKGGRKSVATSCEIERINLETKKIDKFPLPGQFNMHPAEGPNGWVFYVTNELGYRPSKKMTSPSLQLAKFNIHTGEHEIIDYKAIGSILHPFLLRNGLVGYSTYESQGYRDSRLWAIWASRQDGTGWHPLISAFSGADAWHFATQLPTGRICSTAYYNRNQQGFGAVYCITDPHIVKGRPVFGSYRSAENAALANGCGWKSPARDTRRIPFQPVGMENMVEFANTRDNEGCLGEGKVSHPGAMTDGSLLMTYRPYKQLNYYRTSIVKIQANEDGVITPAVNSVDLTPVLDEPLWNEYYAREIASFEELHGHPVPVLEGTPSPLVAPGEPFGYIGSSSTCWESVQVDDSIKERLRENFYTQGAALVPFDCESIVGMRILEMVPSKAKNIFDWQQYQISRAHGYQERLRILGEVPIYPDGSWLARVPANMAICFIPIDAAGKALAACATWKQVRPGEDRHDCGGCHAHDKIPVAFEGTMAWQKAQAGALLPDVALSTPLMQDGGPMVVQSRAVDVEFADTGLGNYEQAIALFDNLDGSKIIAANPDLNTRTLNRWISLAGPKDAGGWYRDDQPPVVSAQVDGSRLYVGAYDTRDEVVPTVTVDGAAVDLEQVDGNRWRTTFEGGMVRVEAADASGNVGRLERFYAAPACEQVITFDPPGCNL
jgi:hypothetical protein